MAKTLGRELTKDEALTLGKTIGTTLLRNTTIEGSSEAGTQLTQNLADVFTGVNPNQNPFEGVMDAAIIGAFSGAGITGISSGAIRQQNTAVENSLLNRTLLESSPNYKGLIKELQEADRSITLDKLAEGQLDPDLIEGIVGPLQTKFNACLLYTSPSPRDRTRSRMPSSA